MSTHTHKAIVQQFYEALDCGNFEQAKQVVAVNFVAHLPGMPNPLNLDAFIQFVLMFPSAFPDGKHSFEDIIVAEDKVVTRGTFRGTHQKEFLGIPPTGKQIEFSFMYIDQIVDNKIVEHWGQGDRLDMMQQLGVVPPLTTQV